MGFVRSAAGDVAILLILFLLQLCAASAWMWRTIDTSWGFTLREDNSTCVYRNSIHALSASDRGCAPANARAEKEESTRFVGSSFCDEIQASSTQPRSWFVEL